MKTMWKNYKLLIVSIGYILAISSFLYFIFFPHMDKVKQKSDSIEEKKVDSQITRSKLEKIPQMEKDFEVFQENKSAVSVIIDQQDIVSFIKKLESLAVDTGNKITITVDESGNNNNKNKKPAKDKEKAIKDDLSHGSFILLNVNLMGGYNNLINFINKLENDNYYANIVSLDMHKKVGTKDNTENNNRSIGDIFSSRTVPQESEHKEKENVEVLNSNLGLVIYIKN